MQLRITRIALFLALLASLPALGQEDASWALGQFPYETDEAREEINRLVDAGLVPVGLSVDEGASLTILFARVPDYEVSRWSVHPFDDPDSLEAEMTTIMKRGWEPTGLARAPKAIYGLFVRTDRELEGWRLHKTKAEDRTIQQTIRDFRSEGFRIRDISYFEGSAWFLFVDSGADTSSVDVILETFASEQDALKPGVTARIAEGWLPWGVTRDSDATTVLFTR